MIIRNSKTVYLMGIGGIAMGTLAAMLKEKGFQVTGSDQNLYPPMSTHLDALGITVHKGYAPDNPQKTTRPDLVVIGNVIRRNNPEAQHVLEQGLKYVSMPQAISRFFLADHESIVVTGTHGKSTTASLLAWVLARGGLDPSAFIGAFVKNWNRSYRLGSGKYMVIEGDEYDTAFFDKGPKFLHYSPYIGLITSIEYDHADIFPNFDAVLKAFENFIDLITPAGTLVVNADDPHCIALSKKCKGRVMTYGWNDRADWRLLDADYQEGRVLFRILNPLSNTEEMLVSPLAGRHNVGNTIAAIASAALAGMSLEAIQDGLLSFEGVQRRQDVIGEYGGVLVVDDFAHHPTAVRETLQALRLFYPGRSLYVAFEPRSNSSRRSIFQADYATAFDCADCVCIKEPPGIDSLPADERLDARKLVTDIGTRRKEAHYFENVERLVLFLSGRCTSGDLVVAMSNGSFDGLLERLPAAFLTQRPSDHVQETK